MSPWMIFNWGFILIAIVIGIWIFYGAKLDTRDYESKLLAERISDCVSNGGYLKAEALNKDFDLFKECSLSKKVLVESEDYSLRLTIYEGRTAGNKLNEISFGSKDIDVKCGLKMGGVKGDSFPGCYLMSFRALSSDKNVLIEIYTASNNEGAKV